MFHICTCQLGVCICVLFVTSFCSLLLYVVSDLVEFSFCLICFLSALCCQVLACIHSSFISQAFLTSFFETSDLDFLFFSEDLEMVLKKIASCSSLHISVWSRTSQFSPFMSSFCLAKFVMLPTWSLCYPGDIGTFVSIVMICLFPIAGVYFLPTQRGAG